MNIYILIIIYLIILKIRVNDLSYALIWILTNIDCKMALIKLYNVKHYGARYTTEPNSTKTTKNLKF